jgi:hypothetical protein
MTIKDSTSYLFFLFLSRAISVTAFQYMSSVLGQINTLTEKEEASQSGNQTLHITKVATNSYTIASDASFIGSFNTTYHVVGGVESMDVSEDIIISTITQDFDALPEMICERYRYLFSLSSNSKRTKSSQSLRNKGRY